MKKLATPENFTTLGKFNKTTNGQEEGNEKKPQKTDNTSKKDKSKNSPVKSETANSNISNEGQKDNKVIENDELDVKEETTAMTVEYYDRHMDYIDRRIAKKLLNSDGKSRKNRRKSRSDFSKEVRGIIDEAIERDNK